MKQSKFSWLDAITLGAVLLFGLFYFLSLNFLLLENDGRIMEAMIKAIIVALLVGGSAFVAKQLKTTEGRLLSFRFCYLLELTFLMFFIIFSISRISEFSHFFGVFAKKDEIRKDVISNIEQIEGMYAKYTEYANLRIEKYNGQLREAVDNKNRGFRSQYRELGFQDNINDNEQINNKIRNLRFQLYPSNYDEKRSADTLWHTKARHTVDDWLEWTFGIVNVISNVENRTMDRLNELTGYSEFRVKENDKEVEIADNFTYPLSFDNVKGMFTEKATSTMFSVIFALALFAMMLLSYCFSERDGKILGKSRKFFVYKNILFKPPSINNQTGEVLL